MFWWKNNISLTRQKGNVLFCIMLVKVPAFRASLCSIHDEKQAVQFIQHYPAHVTRDKVGRRWRRGGQVGGLIDSQPPVRSCRPLT